MVQAFPQRERQSDREGEKERESLCVPPRYSKSLKKNPTHTKTNTHTHAHTGEMRCKSDNSLGSNSGLSFVNVCILCVCMWHSLCICVSECDCVCRESCSTVSVCPGVAAPVQLSSHNTVVGAGALCDCGRERNYLWSLDNIFSWTTLQAVKIYTETLTTYRMSSTGWQRVGE